MADTNDNDLYAPQNTSPSVTPIYHSRSLLWGKANKLCGFLTFFVAAISIVVCAVVGSTKADSTDFLALLNIALTNLIAVVHVWWYRKSHLAEEKLWFLFFIYMVIWTQCITSVIYICIQTDGSLTPTTTTTPVPPITRHANATAYTLRPASTRKLLQTIKLV
ncbi:uncharacterized protein [Watersipora subatra]|uniref:uncharacterized protein n=1 Tax=Watersipora subatra TaxID=2589382 RepID=UPI00355BE2E1